MRAGAMRIIGLICYKLTADACITVVRLDHQISLTPLQCMHTRHVRILCISNVLNGIAWVTILCRTQHQSKYLVGLLRLS